MKTEVFFYDTLLFVVNFLESLDFKLFLEALFLNPLFWLTEFIE
jgi:hypothetical protein